MSEVIYEFTGDSPCRPRRKWLVAVLLIPAVAAAAWGIVVLERLWSEALVQGSFSLVENFDGRFVAATAHVAVVPKETFDFLSGIPRLQMIDLSRTTMVPGGLRSLRQIDDLRILSLRDCAWVDDEQAVWLGELTNLESLDLSGTHITDVGLRAVSKLPRLNEGVITVLTRWLPECLLNVICIRRYHFETPGVFAGEVAA